MKFLQLTATCSGMYTATTESGLRRTRSFPELTPHSQEFLDNNALLRGDHYFVQKNDEIFGQQPIEDVEMAPMDVDTMPSTPNALDGQHPTGFFPSAAKEKDTFSPATDNQDVISTEEPTGKALSAVSSTSPRQNGVVLIANPDNLQAPSWKASDDQNLNAEVTMREVKPYEYGQEGEALKHLGKVVYIEAPHRAFIATNFNTQTGELNGLWTDLNELKTRAGLPIKTTVNMWDLHKGTPIVFAARGGRSGGLLGLTRPVTASYLSLLDHNGQVWAEQGYFKHPIINLSDEQIQGMNVLPPRQ